MKKDDLKSKYIILIQYICSITLKCSDEKVLENFPDPVDDIRAHILHR